MVYCMGPKETTAAIEAIESNIHDDGKGWTIEGVRPDLYVWNVGCVHGKRTGECGSSLIGWFM